MPGMIPSHDVNDTSKTDSSPKSAIPAEKVTMPGMIPSHDVNDTSKKDSAPKSAIPAERVRDLKEIAEYASRHAVNHMKRCREDARQDEEFVRRQYNALCESKFFTSTFCFLFEEMAWAAAWSTANERLGSRDEAAICKQKWIDCHKELFLSGEVTGQLANDLRDLCWFSAWYTVNTRKGIFYKRDAEEDARKIDMYCKRITSK